MASSQIIYSSIRNELSLGQIATWRLLNFENLHKNNKYNINDLKSLMDIEPVNFNENEYFEHLLNKIKENMILGNYSHEDIIFVKIDSSVMCKYSIYSLLENINKEMNIEESLIVIISSNIGLIENKYKLCYPEKYTNINFKILKQNIECLENKMIIESDNDGDTVMDRKLQNIICLQTDFFLDNIILNTYETEYLNIEEWKNGARNEINDNAQLDILYQIKSKIPESIGIMISNDNGLLKKSLDMDLMIYNP